MESDIHTCSCNIVHCNIDEHPLGTVYSLHDDLGNADEGNLEDGNCIGNGNGSGDGNGSGNGDNDGDSNGVGPMGVGSPGELELVKQQKKIMKRRWKGLDRRLQKVEAMLGVVMTVDQRSMNKDPRGISKACFLEAITEAIHSEQYPCGVSKVYIKKQLSEKFLIDFQSQHYSKKLNGLLKVGIRENVFRFDCDDGLYKST